MLVNAVKEQQNQLKEKDAQIQAILHELEALKEVVLKQSPDTKIPTSARLGQNVPNPYNQSTTIPYFVPEAAISAQLKVFSISGQEVQSISITRKGAGEVTLSNSQLAAGTYIYHLVDGQSVANKKMVLTR